MHMRSDTVFLYLLHTVPIAPSTHCHYVNKTTTTCDVEFGSQSSTDLKLCINDCGSGGRCPCLCEISFTTEVSSSTTAACSENGITANISYITNGARVTIQGTAPELNACLTNPQGHSLHCTTLGNDGMYMYMYAHVRIVVIQ